MPHLQVHVAESFVAGREQALIARLTDAVVEVYGAHFRDSVQVILVGVPDGRWGVGGAVAAAPAPLLTMSIRETVFERPDADALVRRLVSGLTRAVEIVLGETVAAGTLVQLVAEVSGRTGVGGDIAF